MGTRHLRVAVVSVGIVLQFVILCADASQNGTAAPQKSTSAPQRGVQPVHTVAPSTAAPQRGGQPVDNTDPSTEATQTDGQSVLNTDPSTAVPEGGGQTIHNTVPSTDIALRGGQTGRNMDLSIVAPQKALLQFNPIGIMVCLNQEAHLDCGVMGVYSSCHWAHGNHTYQLVDVIKGIHNNMKAASMGITNQCGIIIKSVSESHNGSWICNVITLGQNLTASKDLTLEPAPKPVDRGYYYGWAAFLSIAIILGIVIAIVSTCLKKKKNTNEYKPQQQDDSQYNVI